MSYYDWDYYYGRSGCGIIGTIILFLLNMPFINAVLVAIVPVLLTRTNGYEKIYYWIMFGVAFVISMFLQLRFVLFRIIYGLFTCLVVAFFCYVWDKKVPMLTRYTAVAVGVGITIIFNFLSWMVID